MPVFVSNLQEKVPVDEQLLELAKKTAQVAVLEAGGPEAAEISLALVDDDYIRQLNREYRGIDKPTDVLSFAMREGELLPGGEDLLGDVVVSLETAQRQCREYGHSFEREVAFLIAHGVLHLLGYDHQDEEGRRAMREKEEAVLSRLGLTR